MFNSVDFKNKSHQHKTLFFLKSYSTGRTHREMCFAFHLNWKEIKPVHPQGNQFWIVIGRTDAETETPILWPPDVKNWLIGKDPDAGKDWRQEKGTIEDEMVEWHRQLKWTWVWASWCWWWTGKPGVLQSVGRKELDMTEQLNWTRSVSEQKVDGVDGKEGWLDGHREKRGEKIGEEK